MTDPRNVPNPLANATELDQMTSTRSSPMRGDPCADMPSALASFGAELLRRAEESQPALEAAWDELMAKCGIHGEPVGIQRLRAMIDEDSGWKPTETMVSSEIIANREKSRP